MSGDKATNPVADKLCTETKRKSLLPYLPTKPSVLNFLSDSCGMYVCWTITDFPNRLVLLSLRKIELSCLMATHYWRSIALLQLQHGCFESPAEDSSTMHLQLHFSLLVHFLLLLLEIWWSSIRHFIEHVYTTHTYSLVTRPYIFSGASP